jgi:hypothetical protein
MKTESVSTVVMPKKVLMAEVRVPESPRVRFYAKDDSAASRIKDVTDKVTKLVIEEIEDDSGYCYLLRLDDKGALVWRTKHPSLQETKWHVEFEYGLPEEKWLPYQE